MSLRTSLPTPVRHWMRSAYVRVGAITARHRLQPDLIIVGGQRCGTTSLFRALEQHPQVVRPTLNKGINYFDVNYHRGPRWYAGHFPLSRTAERNTSAGKNFVTFEASGYYLFHPNAPTRIARDLPDVKILAMLRDPAERAYSAWKHESARGFENESFQRALELEEARIRGEADRMVADPRYQSYSYRHHGYAARGDYVPLLRHYYDRLSSSQIHIVYSESFFADPDHEFRLITDFLGIDYAPDIVHDRHNARASGPMPAEAQELLTSRFKSQADELDNLVGRRPPWGASAATPGGSSDVTPA